MALWFWEEEGCPPRQALVAAASADVLLLMILHRAARGLGYLGEQSSGGDGDLAPQQGKTWKAEWHSAFLVHAAPLGAYKT